MNRVSSIIHLDYARQHGLTGQGIGVAILDTGIDFHPRSEERRVGKECRSRWSPYH